MKPEKSVHRNQEKPADWLSSLLNLNQRASYLLKSGLWSDCIFLIGPDKVPIAAHKLFLAISSPVFEAMFYGGMAEGSDPIPIPDVQPEAFKSLLEFVYTEHVTINTFEDACEIFYTAKKYLVTSLINYCQTQLVRQVTTSNVCHAYELASTFDEQELMATCEKVMTGYTSEILNLESFLEAHPSTLVKLFSLDHLNIHNELVLLSAAEKYASARGLRSMTDGDGEPAAKRAKIDEGQASASAPNLVAPGHDTISDFEGSELSEEELKTFHSAVKQIRFLTLSAEELAKRIALCSVVPRDDALAILLHAACDSLPPPRGYSLSRTLRQTHMPNPSTEEQGSQTRAETSIQFSVLNFKTRRRRVESDIFYVFDIPWRLQVVPNEGNFERGEQKTLGLFVKCVQSGNEWSCEAQVTIKLGGVNNNSRRKKFTHLYDSVNHTEGYTNFATWQEASDNTLFCKGNCIVVEVHLSAKKPTRPSGSCSVQNNELI